jgi:hypothetical protein
MPSMEVLQAKDRDSPGGQPRAGMTNAAALHVKVFMGHQTREFLAILTLTRFFVHNQTAHLLALVTSVFETGLWISRSARALSARRTVSSGNAGEKPGL